MNPPLPSLPYRRVATLAALLTLALSACAGRAAAPAPPAPTSGEAAVPLAIHWYRTAAEQRALYEQAYRWAGRHVRDVAAAQTGPWGVVLDADETILDNSTYQLRRARAGLGYSPESWNAWVREEAAPALPGAVAFIAEVKRMGGRVAVVTNRDEAVCEPTRRNLADVGVAADVVLCRQPGPSGKEGRFRAVEEGTTPAALPPLTVVAWVGDNIQDFPGGSQSLRGADVSALADFGVRYFVLPNPMYGSWESNPGG
ncbi:MAG TPA: HAD family acid phosphatase [Longimicrobiales bacterium]|nr:HAD family acid phosphatase [Longimicrobiales bacterium]